MYPMACSPKWAGEAGIAHVFTDTMPRGVRLVLMDDLVTDAAAANPNPRSNVTQLQLPGLPLLHASRRLVFMFAGPYVSDSRQQEFVTGKKGGQPVVNDRLTLDHRRERIDIGQSVLLYSRLYRNAHVHTALRHMRTWAGHPQSNSALESCAKVQGLSGLLPPYKFWPAGQMVTAESMHMSQLGLGLRVNKVQLALVKEYEPDGV